VLRRVVLPLGVGALGVGLAQCAPAASWRPPPSAVIAPAPPERPDADDGGPALGGDRFDVDAVTLVLDDLSLSEAKARAKAGSFLDAARIATRVMEAHPAGSDVRARLAFQVGRLRAQAGDPAGAARAFDEASRGSYVLAQHARFAAGELLLRSGKHKEAADRLREILSAKEPIASQNEARALLAEAEDGLGSFDAAKTLFREHLAIEDREGRDASAVRIRYANALLKHPSEEHALEALRELRAVRTKSLIDDAQELETKALATLPVAKRQEVGSAADAHALARARTMVSPKKARQGLKLVDGPSRSKAPAVACEAGRLKAELLGALGRKGEGADALEAALPSCKGTEAEPAALFSAGKALAATGRHELAEKRFAELESSFPKHRLADDARLHGARAALARGDAERHEKAILGMPEAYPGGDVVADALFELALKQMTAGQWSKAKTALSRGAGLPQKERAYYAAGRFRYYLGRAQIETGDGDAGRRELARVVTDFPLSFYMGLAYARLAEGSPEAARAALDAARGRDRLAKLVIKRVPEMERPAFQRAVELARQGDARLAKAEFDSLGVAKRTAPREIGYVAAILLGRIGPRESHGIMRAATMSLTPVEPIDWLDHYPEGSWRSAWEVAYPRPWLELVQKEAGRARIPETLAYAIMREESAFEPRAVSSAKAYGLMQLIVPTAKKIARPLKLPADPESLKKPEVNVALGCQFLSNARGMFPENPSLAIPGYNAGPGAPKKWIAARGDEDYDLWIERIPYEETLFYTKRVLASLLAYDALYAELPKSEAASLPKRARGR